MPITGLLRNSHGYDHDLVSGVGDVAVMQWGILETWPALRKSSAPNHVPSPIAKRFVEAEEAFARGSWNAAVAMYRSVLDIATKGLPSVPVGQSFYNRLQWLHENHRITPDMKDWADHVRVEGNEALHDPEEFIEDEARPLRLFTETFLRYLFELPGEVAAFRSQTPLAPTAEG